MARQIVDREVDTGLPVEATMVVAMLSQQVIDMHVRLREIDKSLGALQRSDDLARRLSTIPGIRPVGATAFAASVTDPYQFQSGCQFAAWLGLTPLQKSSGARIVSAVSPRWATNICASCSSSAQPRWFVMPNTNPKLPIRAFSRGWRISRSGSRPWLWPTRWPGS